MLRSVERHKPVEKRTPFVLTAALAGALLHSILLVVAWATDPGDLIAYAAILDFPVVILYVDTAGFDGVLPWSLIVGGVYWAGLWSLLAVIARTIFSRGGKRGTGNRRPS